MIWTETTIHDEALPHLWVPGRSQADAHHLFAFDRVTFCMGEMADTGRDVLRRLGRPSNNLMDFLNRTPLNPESFIVKLPEGELMKKIPCDLCQTIYGWDRIFKHWRLFRET